MTYPHHLHAVKQMAKRIGKGIKEPVRRNPRIIVETIREIIDADFNGNVRDAATAFTQQGKLNNSRKEREITASVLYSLLSDKNHIKYYQLEAIASYLGIPTGILLIYTRIKADVRDDLLNPIDTENVHLQRKDKLTSALKIMAKLSENDEICIDDIKSKIGILFDSDQGSFDF